MPPPSPFSPPRPLPVCDAWPLRHPQHDSRLPVPIHPPTGTTADQTRAGGLYYSSNFNGGWRWEHEADMQHLYNMTEQLGRDREKERKAADGNNMQQRQVNMTEQRQSDMMERRRSTEGNKNENGGSPALEHLRKRKAQQQLQSEQMNGGAAREMEGLMAQLRDVKISEPPVPQMTVPQMRKAEEASRIECERLRAAALKLNAQAKANGVAVAVAATAKARAEGKDDRRKEGERATERVQTMEKELMMEKVRKTEKERKFARDMEVAREKELQRHREKELEHHKEKERQREEALEVERESRNKMEKLIKKLRVEMKPVKEKRIEEMRMLKIGKGGDDEGPREGLRLDDGQGVGNAAGKNARGSKCSSAGEVAACESKRTGAKVTEDDKEGVFDEPDEWLEVTQPCKENTGEWWNLDQQCREVKSGGVKRSEAEEEGDDEDDEGWEIAREWIQ